MNDRRTTKTVINIVDRLEFYSTSKESCIQQSDKAMSGLLYLGRYPLIMIFFSMRKQMIH